MLTLNIVIGLSQAPFRVEIATLGAQKADNEYFCMQDIKVKRILAKAGITLFPSNPTDDLVAAMHEKGIRLGIAKIGLAAKVHSKI